jgi:hypothetical protein
VQERACCDGAPRDALGINDHVHEDSGLHKLANAGGDIAFGTAAGGLRPAGTTGPNIRALSPDQLTRVWGGAGPSLVAGGKSSRVVAYEVGTYDDLVVRSVVGDDLALHHAGQARVMEQIVPGFRRSSGPSIALPTAEHRAIPNLRGTATMTPRDLLARDIRNLRTHTGASGEAILELIRLNKALFPEAFRR